MNKKIIGIIIFASFLITVNAGAAVTLQNPLKVDSLTDLLANILLVVAGLVATVSTIMITVSGIMYLTSAGSPEKINKAKTAFIYAVIGFVIAISASTIIVVIKSIIGAK